MRTETVSFNMVEDCSHGPVTMVSSPILVPPQSSHLVPVTLQGLWWIRSISLCTSIEGRTYNSAVYMVAIGYGPLEHRHWHPFRPPCSSTKSFPGSQDRFTTITLDVRSFEPLGTPTFDLFVFIKADPR